MGNRFAGGRERLLGALKQNICAIIAIILSLIAIGENMQFSELIAKMGRGEQLDQQEQSELYTQARQMEQASSLFNSIIRPGSSIIVVDGLVARNATVDTAVITDAIIQHAVAGDGHVIIGSSGIDIIEGVGSAYLTFYASDGTTRRFQLATDTGGFQLQSVIPGESIDLFIKLTDLTTPYVRYEEDASQANRAILSVGAGANGSRMTMDGDTGAGSTSMIDFRTQGSAGGSTFMRMRETANTPPGGGADAYHMYMKGDKLIIQFNASGTAHYFYLDMTATSNQSWIYSATAP
jgi:hypothetical protein